MQRRKQQIQNSPLAPPSPRVACGAWCVCCCVLVRVCRGSWCVAACAVARACSVVSACHFVSAACTSLSFPHPVCGFASSHPSVALFASMASARASTPIYAPAWPVAEKDAFDLRIAWERSLRADTKEHAALLFGPPGAKAGVCPDRAAPRCLTSDAILEVSSFLEAVSRDHKGWVEMNYTNDLGHALWRDHPLHGDQAYDQDMARHVAIEFLDNRGKLVSLSGVGALGSNGARLGVAVLALGLNVCRSRAYLRRNSSEPAVVEGVALASPPVWLLDLAEDVMPRDRSRPDIQSYTGPPLNEPSGTPVRSDREKRGRAVSREGESNKSRAPAWLDPSPVQSAARGSQDPAQPMRIFNVELDDAASARDSTGRLRRLHLVRCKVCLVTPSANKHEFFVCDDCGDHLCDEHVAGEVCGCYTGSGPKTAPAGRLRPRPRSRSRNKITLKAAPGVSIQEPAPTAKPPPAQQSPLPDRAPAPATAPAGGRRPPWEGAAAAHANFVASAKAATTAQAGGPKQASFRPVVSDSDPRVEGFADSRSKRPEREAPAPPPPPPVPEQYERPDRDSWSRGSPPYSIRCFRWHRAPDGELIAICGKFNGPDGCPKFAGGGLHSACGRAHYCSGCNDHQHGLSSCPDSWVTAPDFEEEWGPQDRWEADRVHGQRSNWLIQTGQRKAPHPDGSFRRR